MFLIIYGFLKFFKCILCINCYDHVVFLLSLLLCFTLVALWVLNDSWNKLPFDNKLSVMKLFCYCFGLQSSENKLNTVITYYIFLYWWIYFVNISSSHVPAVFLCGIALVIFLLQFVGCQILLSRLCWPYKMCWKPFQLFLVSERICACCYFFLVCLSEFTGELSSVLVICIFKEFAIFLEFHCFKLIMITLCYLFHVWAVSSDATAFSPSYITSLSLFHSLPFLINIVRDLLIELAFLKCSLLVLLIHYIVCLLSFHHFYSLFFFISTFSLLLTQFFWKGFLDNCFLSLKKSSKLI